MRIFIAGMDGYLGWSLAQYLSARGHEVGGADLFLRRQWVEEMGSWSAIPIVSMKDRLAAMKERGMEPKFWEADLRDYLVIERIFKEAQPEAVVHLGECPSAPYSMVDVHHATFVQTNNVVSTFNLMFAIRDLRPEAYLLKLGTMGEYGTPNVDIPEGFFEIEYRGRRDRMPFPRQPGQLLSPLESTWLQQHHAGLQALEDARHRRDAASGFRQSHRPDGQRRTAADPA